MKIIKKSLKYLIILFGLYIAWNIIVPRISLIGTDTKHKVYIAFGFHGNMYHSFRIDTNDEAGFGKDIRVIRNTIKVLDKYNKMGVPVRGVWDIENLFTLQETIPEHAPDIITDLQRRVKENNDEILIMSYNNGLTSAMNEREFMDSMKRAITNKDGSGVKDLFAEYTPLVRPQEMMYTPGNYRAYQKLGIDAMSMYYSAITFDTFRVFSRELSRKEAHNPLYYVNKDTGEKMKMIPTYNIGDLVENVSLRRWAQELNREQRRGNIDSDVLIFINFDADDNFWYGLTLPDYLKSLPNTGGLDQLIHDVKDLEFVEFTTLKEYMKDHKPVGEVEFGQDTADGSFNGYNSWSEKAYSSTYWKHLENDRRIHAAVEKSFPNMPQSLKNILKQSYESRLRLLSTTNFGMATPYLARARERVVEEIIQDMNESAQKAEKMLVNKLRNEILSTSTHPDGIFIEKFTAVNLEQNTTGSGKILNIRQPLDNLVKKIGIKNTNSAASAINNASFFVTNAKGNKISSYTLPCRKENGIITIPVFINEDFSDQKSFSLFYSEKPETQKRKTQSSKTSISNGLITLKWNEDGIIEEVLLNKNRQLEKNSLLPKIHYGDGLIKPENIKTSILKDGSNGVVSVQISGELNPADEFIVRKGKFQYTFSLIENIPFLILDSQIKYPETKREDIIKGHIPSLARKIDEKWIETMPAELLFSYHATEEKPFRVLKRNYFEVQSSYALDYYLRSSENEELDNINNHITSEYAAVASQELNKGVIVGYDITRLANFAYAPMKMKKRSSQFQISVNPFGTYFGDQYDQPTWGNENGFNSAFITGEQYITAAPTYNGYPHEFTLFISFFDGSKIPDDIERQTRAFAHPPYIVEKSSIVPEEKPEYKIHPPEGFLALYNVPNKKISKYEKEGTYFHWEKIDNAKSYKIYLGKTSQKYDRVLTAKGTTLFTQALKRKQNYCSAITSIYKNGKESKKSDEICFVADAEMGGKKGTKIPISLQLKILWDTLISYID